MHRIVFVWYIMFIVDLKSFEMLISWQKLFLNLNKPASRKPGDPTMKVFVQPLPVLG